MRRMIIFLALLLATWVSCPSRSLAEVPVLKGIRVFPAGESFGVEITTDKDLVYTCTKIPPLRKIVVDLPNTETGRPDGCLGDALHIYTFEEVWGAWVGSLLAIFPLEKSRHSPFTGVGNRRLQDRDLNI